jgi:hypothetical protein
MAWAFPPPYGRKPLDDRLAILRGGRCPDAVRPARLTGREPIACAVPVTTPRRSEPSTLILHSELGPAPSSPTLERRIRSPFGQKSMSESHSDPSHSANNVTSGPHVDQRLSRTSIGDILGGCRGRRARVSRHLAQARNAQSRYRKSLFDDRGPAPCSNPILGCRFLRRRLRSLEGLRSGN